LGLPQSHGQRLEARRLPGDTFIVEHFGWPKVRESFFCAAVAFEDYLETLVDGIEQNGYGIAQKSVTSNLRTHGTGIPIQLRGQIDGPRAL